jgi:hypothetical protein
MENSSQLWKPNPDRDHESRQLTGQECPNPLCEASRMCPRILELITYLRNLVGKMCEAEYPTVGVSRRGSQMLYRAAQIVASLEGCDCCTSEHFKAAGLSSSSSSFFFVAHA